MGDFFGSLLGGIGLNWFDKTVDRYYGEKSTRDTAAVNYAYQQLLQQDEYRLTQQLTDWLGQYNYDLAKRYGLNTASWAVEGLRRAGLNPILAAGQGFNANLGSATGAAHVGGGTVNAAPTTNASNSAGAIKDVASAVNSAKSVDLMDSQIDSINTGVDKTKVEIEAQQLDNAQKRLDILEHMSRGGNKQGSVIGDFGGNFYKLLHGFIPSAVKTSQSIVDDVERLLKRPPVETLHSAESTVRRDFPKSNRSIKSVEDDPFKSKDGYMLNKLFE